MARLWLACIVALLTCATHLLSPALQRRLPLLDLPRTMLAAIVARLILMCAIEHAGAPKHSRQMRGAGALRALLRAGVRRHLVNADGDLDIAAIARTCANPEAAIADMAAALEAGLTRRRPILARPAREALPAFPAQPKLAICDSS